jgi:MFS family permease
MGGGLVGFGLGVWVYEKTGSITQFAIVLLLDLVPRVVLAPVAGVIVDRYDRRRVMIASDVAASLITLSVALLYFAGRLEFAHVYLANLVGSIVLTVQEPAFQVARTEMVPKSFYSQSNGLVTFAATTSRTLVPLAAGVLLTQFGLGPLLLLNLVTYAVAIGTLVAVRFPLVRPRVGPGPATFREEFIAGWGFIAANPAVRSLLLFSVAVNLGLGFTWVIYRPLVLSISSPAVMGTISSVMGLGMLAGGVLMSAWKVSGKILDVLLCASLLMGIGLAVMGITPAPTVIGVGMFVIAFAVPVFNSSAMTLFQASIPIDLQGRVFATLRGIVKSTEIASYAGTGPLVTYVMLPILDPASRVTGGLARFFGTGSSRAMGLLLVVAGAYVLIVAIRGFYAPLLRTMEGIPATPAVPEVAVQPVSTHADNEQSGAEHERRQTTTAVP